MLHENAARSASYGSTPKSYGSTPKSYGSTPKSYGSTPKSYGSTPQTSVPLRYSVTWFHCAYAASAALNE
jgi:hypothetical protein